MRSRLLFYTTLSVFPIMTGCATSTYDYFPAEPTVVQNSRLIPKSFDLTWDHLVRQLSKDFFVINNIEKGSRIINVSFSTSTPSDYIDCGSTLRTFSGAPYAREYSYLNTDSAVYRFKSDSGYLQDVRRKTKLEGRANIYIAPEGTGTMVSVNTKYILTVNSTLYNMQGAQIGNDIEQFDFSTKSGASGRSGMTCYTKGTLENRIVGFTDGI